MPQPSSISRSTPAEPLWSRFWIYYPIDTSIMVISESATIAAGSMGMFECVAYGYPAPSLTWDRDGTPLSNGSRSTIYEELVVANGKTFVQSILVICSLEQDDAAKYNCSASNNISTTSGSFNLTVNSIRMYTLAIIRSCLTCKTRISWYVKKLFRASRAYLRQNMIAYVLYTLTLSI